MAFVLNLLLLAREDDAAYMPTDPPTTSSSESFVSALLKAWPCSLVVQAAKKTLWHADSNNPEVSLPFDEQVLSCLA
jgi:hypothetical protein